MYKKLISYHFYGLFFAISAFFLGPDVRWKSTQREEL